MLVTDNDGWIDQVRRLVASATPAAATLRKTNAFDEIQVDAHAPDCVLTNQLGKTIHLSDFTGRAPAFTFIFTRCPFPTFCPHMSNNFSEAQSRLLAKTTETNWHFISISFDPNSTRQSG